jgi:zinc protease
VISGNVKVSDVKQLAEKYMEPIPAGPAPEQVHLVEPPQTGERRITVQKEVTTPYMIISYHVPEARHKDYYALSILSSILSSGNSSRLYSALVDKKQLATSVFTNYSESFDPTLFEIYAVSSKPTNELELEKAVYTEIENIQKNGISERELQKIKNQKLMEFYNQVETINGKSNNLGTYEIFHGDFKKMFTAPAEYNKVTAEDVKRVATEYLKKSNRTVGVLKANVEE